MTHNSIPPLAPAPNGGADSGYGQMVAAGEKSFVTTWLLSLFLGGLGIDRFYLGKIGTGVVKLLTGGAFGVWSLVDLILVLAGKQTDKNGRPLAGYGRHKVKAIVITIALIVLSWVVAFSMMAAAASGASKAVQAAESASSAAASAAAPAAAPVAAPAAPQAGSSAKVGVPFEIDMGAGNTARITIVSAQFVDKVSDSSFAPAPKNGKFLKLDVLWETTKGKTSSNPRYFAARDADGRKGDFVLTADGGLSSADVLAGDKSRGVVAFDIKPGPVTVSITNAGLQTQATIQVTP